MKHTARVYLICNNPKILPVGRIMNGGEPVTALVDLEGRTRDEAKKNIDKAYEFKEWW
ncbi:hypothetical protein KAR91_50615 [Candidatus Pacearchaeota archaeon]|nr:hypothetical protein [Candidatus Pacearchaeota archaeon]